MSSESQLLEDGVVELQALVVKQGDTVRALKAQLKANEITRDVVDAAIEKLRELKSVLDAKQKAYEAATGKTTSLDKEAFRATLANVLERRLFYIPSFKIYGAVAGFYDYGPPGCAIKQNVTQFWRQHFVLEESMLEVECPAVTPEVVLKASGHVDRFTDYMVRDAKTGDCFRADHLLEDALDKFVEDKKNPPSADKRSEAEALRARVGELKAEALGAGLTQYGVKAPETGNDISAPFEFNLMFKTSIGPRGDLVGFMRPETAQGIFVNFRDLYYYNGQKLPFAAAQIGNSFRNEISPRAGLLRVREFTQAEIEHFCDPLNKKHPKFHMVAHLEPLLYSREMQMGDERKPRRVNLGEAVRSGTIVNETLAYFIGRTHLFFLSIGMNPERVRFRQHLRHEMAHYAEDCWDGEVECSYGWVECCGLADRSAYDLDAHSKMSKQDLSSFEKYDEPRLVEIVAVKPNKQAIGKEFKKDAKAVQAALESLPEAAALELQQQLESAGQGKLAADGQEFTVSKDHVVIQRETKKETGRNFTPAVIEPSFGIGRIIYCLFEHCFYTRPAAGGEQAAGQEDKKTVFRFSPVVAPIKVTIFPLMQKEELNTIARQLSHSITRAGLTSITDTTGTTIGKRYARTDEIGVPFAITVDFDTVADKTVTLRDRDTTGQVRIPIAEVAGVLRGLVDGELEWSDVQGKYPAQSARED